MINADFRFIEMIKQNFKKIGVIVIMFLVSNIMFCQSDSFQPVNCKGGKTKVVDVHSPKTNRVWMDRNLGAQGFAVSSTDKKAYGDLYQWGRRSDGHQCRKSPTTNSKSRTGTPIHGNFIVDQYFPWDWLTKSDDNLWDKKDGINNPCPIGYSVPTDAEFEAERITWKMNNSIGALESPLHLTLSGYRSHSDGELSSLGVYGGYWTSSISNFSNSIALLISTENAYVFSSVRGNGFSVRCIKNN